MTNHTAIFQFQYISYRLLHFNKTVDALSVIFRGFLAILVDAYTLNTPFFTFWFVDQLPAVATLRSVYTGDFCGDFSHSDACD